MYKDSASWIDIHTEYKESNKKINELKKRRTGTGLLADEVDCQNAGSMIGELSSTIKELKNRSLYEYRTMSADDIDNPIYRLTPRQREILKLRQKYSFKVVSDILHIDQSTAYNIFKSAIRKVEKTKLKERTGEVVELSSQQNEVLELINMGLKNKEIALRLSISENTVKVQKNRLKKRLTKP